MIMGLLVAAAVIVASIVSVVIFESSTENVITTGTASQRSPGNLIPGGPEANGNPPQSFAGTIEGVRIAGIATDTFSAGDFGSPSISTAPSATGRYRGSS